MPYITCLSTLAKFITARQTTQCARLTPFSPGCANLLAAIQPARQHGHHRCAVLRSTLQHRDWNSRQRIRIYNAFKCSPSNPRSQVGVIPQALPSRRRRRPRRRVTHTNLNHGIKCCGCSCSWIRGPAAATTRKAVEDDGLRHWQAARQGQVRQCVSGAREAEQVCCRTQGAVQEAAS